ncbi:hypothetical protein AHF37_01466 [Paragonimus kellicotti]|nr:hypothetical protein AHF37_01466 [Paragonimus kellicotti]
MSGDRNQCVLVTGGSGYIGSHTLVELQTAGYDVVAVDNLANSNMDGLNHFFMLRLRRFREVLLQSHTIDYVIHFAALKSVGDSVSQPLHYYENNIVSLLNLLKVYNLGTGTGYSVLEIVKAMEKACGKPIPYKLCPRREGDAAVVYADPALAAKELHWKTKFGLDEMCEDQWRWQTKNPHGYGTSKKP